MLAVKKVSDILKKVFDNDGINIVNNTGKCAGQEVFHIHYHLIPRYNKKKSVSNYIENIEDFHSRVIIAIDSLSRKEGSNE